MAIESDTFSFSDLLSNIVDNRGKTCPVSDAGLPLIATNCVKNDKLFPVFEKVRYVDQETYENWFRGHPLPGDLIFVCKGSPGNVCWTPDPVDFCIAQDMVAIRANEEIVDPKFLFALLRHKPTQAQILNMHVGTLIPHFKKGDFKNLYLDIPKDRKIQEFIGKIYFEFCDKIELNRKMNATLESMAQAMFKSWFVDFDPVIDNALAAGNPIPEPLQQKAQTRKELGDQKKSLPPDIQKLFPDLFQFNEELGWIPEGWECLPLEKTMDAIIDYRGKTPKKTNKGIPLITAKIVKEGRILPFKEYISVDDYDDWMKRGLPAKGDIVMTTEAPLGEVAQLDGQKVALAQRIITLRGNPSLLHNSYLRFLLQSPRVQHDLDGSSSGTTVVGIKQSELRKIHLLIPAVQLQNAYGEFVVPFTDKIDNNWQTASTLAHLRDTLLPKLLSGELRIPDAEKLVAEATV